MSNRTRRSLGLSVLLAVLSGCTIHVYESTGTKTGGQASSGGEAAGGQGAGDRDGADDRDDAQDEDRDGAQDEDRDQDEHGPSTGGDKPSTGGGDKPSTGGGDKPSTGGGDKPATGGGDKPSTGGGDKPATGGGDKPATGGGDKPSTGGGDKPATGSGGDKPATGSGDTPTTKPPVLKPPVLKPPVVPVKPKPNDKPVDPHAGHDGDDGKHDGDTAHGGGTGTNPEPGKPQRTEPGHGSKPNLEVDRPVVPSRGSVVTAPDKNKRPSAAHGSLHLPTSAVRTALAPDVCRLYARTFRPGARLRVKVEGVPDSAELYLDGAKLEMVRRDSKAWVAKLPTDAKSGVVILQSGKDAVSCGRIEVK